MFATPQLIQTEVFTEVPQALRKSSIIAERMAAGRGMPKAGCFLEGPSFDRAGNLYFVDNTYGRIFRASPQGKVEVVAEYDGEPNGLRIHKDGRIFVADFMHGIMQLDPASGKVTPVVSRYQTEHFKGVNDLTFAGNGDLYFTDQGQTDLNYPTGRVYCLTAAGHLRCIADNVPSPNGLVLNLADDVLYLAVTRANAVWRLPFTPTGEVARMGVFLQLSGGRGPDGIAIDETGGLAVAHPEMGVIWIFSPYGEPLYRVQSRPGDMTTNIAYGGPNRKTLYITDSTTGTILMARVPTAGRVLYSHL